MAECPLMTKVTVLLACFPFIAFAQSQYRETLEQALPVAASCSGTGECSFFI
jgi:hypothetical protein